MYGLSVQSKPLPLKIRFRQKRHVSMAARIHFIDNLRTTMIFLVVLYHAGGVYESSGIWSAFWIVDDPLTNHISGMILLVLDIFMMPALFFISGYFTPSSIGRKRGKEFILNRARRILLPWFIAVFTLIPLYRSIFLFSRNLPQENWQLYFHLYHPNSQNWLWFLPVLFTFNMIFLLISKTDLSMPDISLKHTLFGMFALGFIYSFAMDLTGLRGWTLTPVLDFQNERILIYFLFFLLGARCFHLKVFDTPPDPKKQYMAICLVSWIPISAYLFFLLFPFIFSPGNVLFSKNMDRTIVWAGFHLSAFCLVYIMVETFRRYVNTGGMVWTVLNRNSYSIYIIHVILIGLGALLLLNLPIPSFLKHMILAVSTFLTGNVMVSLCRKPWTR